MPANPAPSTPPRLVPPPTPPALPVPSVQPSLAQTLSVSHLIMQGKEPKPDVNYDLGDNVENDH